MTRPIFFYIQILLVFIVSSFGFSESDRKKDKKLVELLQFRWTGPKTAFHRKKALENAKELRKLLRGERGKKGRRGKRGVRGKKGHKGSTGSRGPRGATGPQGKMGITGPTGETGQKGISEVIKETISLWEVKSGELSFIFRPIPGKGAGFWQAIVVSPSGKIFISKAAECATDDVSIKISPVEIGVYTLCWKNNFEKETLALVLKEIEVDSTLFNGEHFFYNKFPKSRSGEQRTISHVIVENSCKLEELPTLEEGS